MENVGIGEDGTISSTGSLSASDFKDFLSSLWSNFSSWEAIS